MTARPGALSVYSPADRPQLIRAVAEMRWREWEDEPGREELSWWVEAGRRPSAFLTRGVSR